MTKEITKAYILQQIQDKFHLREWEPEVFSFSEKVVPVYDISQHVQQWRSTNEQKTITGTGQINFFTVPGNEKWHLRRYDAIFMGGGAYTVAGINTFRKLDTKYIYLDLSPAQSASYHIDLVEPVVLESNDQLGVNVDGYTSPQDLRLCIDYRKEEIR